MIKVNLLESVTDRPAGVAFVEDKISSTRTQTFLLALTVLALLVLGIGFDYVSAIHVQYPPPAFEGSQRFFQAGSAGRFHPKRK